MDTDQKAVETSTEVSRQVEYRIKTILKESNHGWTTKQVEEMIIQESGVRYHHNYIYRRILRKWSFKQKYQGSNVNTVHPQKKRRE
jgi:transposase